ncbi:MAG TPA: cation:proton antiporter, partial [Hyphomicrobiales bacterium]|nr:cation:proton antiporter [Hyphomicrobiales bacterium]
MNDAGLLLGIGLLMLASIAVDALGRKTFLPRVSLLILLGIAAGPEFLDLLPVRLIEHSHLVTNISLAMVAFLLGGELSFERLRRLGRAIVSVSLLVVVATAAFVGGGLALLGAPPVLAVMLAGIATATDPAAAQDVVHESGSRSNFSRTILGVVAIDDGWGVILFGVLLGASSLLNGGSGGHGGDAVLHALREVGG